MKAIASEIEEKVDELLACLDTDVKHIEESLSHLNELRSLVIKRDDATLGRLLESIRAGSSRHADHDAKRQAIRKDLAKMLGCEFERMTLTALASRVPESRKRQIKETQATLRALTEKLRKEHTSTALLLSECARFNNLLLKSVFNLGRTGGVYYDSSGGTKRQTAAALMSLQL